MLKVIIYKDKITATKWDEDAKIWSEHDISKSDGPIVKYLNRMVEIKPDVTVEDFMLHLEKHETVIDYCFSDYMNDLSLRTFLDDMNKESIETDLEEVVLCWEGEIINEDLVIAGYLMAWMKEEKIKELGEEYDQPHDISFLSLQIWKKCKFSLSEGIVINDFGDISNISNMSSINNEIIFSGFYRWTLFDVISNFLGDLSINGSPEERDKLFAQMQTKEFDIKEVAKNIEQAEFWVAFLENELANLRALLSDSLDEEEYERVPKLKKDIASAEKEINELKEEIKKNEGQV